MRILITLLTTLLLMVSSTISLAQSNKNLARYVEGVDYKVLDKAVRTTTGDKIEVTEAFSFLCGHCYRFETPLKKWHKTIADDVQLVKMHVVFKANMEHFARILYTGEVLKVSDEIVAATFRAIHIERKTLRSPSAVAELFESIGVSSKDYNKTSRSFGVNTRVKQAGLRTRSMKITSTPQMVVDGRYLISTTRELGQQGMLDIADYLINKIRNERSK